MSFAPESVYSLKTFLLYGDSKASLDEEIRAELFNILKTSITTLAFNRAQGSGVEFLENENFSLEAQALFIMQLIANIMNYNNSVPPERQVAVSQEQVHIEQDSSGQVLVSVYYIQLKDLATASPTVKSLSLPMVT